MRCECIALVPAMASVIGQKSADGIVLQPIRTMVLQEGLNVR